MAVYEGPNMVHDNMILCLDASDKNSYSGSGSNWYDISGNNNNGTMTNCSYNSSYCGGIVFDGTASVNCTSNSITNLSTTGTLSVWCKITDWAGSGSYWSIVGRGAKAGCDTNGYTIWFYTGVGGGSGTIYGHISNRSPVEHSSRGVIFGNDTILGSNIHNYLITWDSTTLYNYLDGSYKTSTNYTYGAGDTSSEPFYIGRNAYSAKMKGVVYQCLIYNRKLSASEVQQNFKSIKGRFGL